MEQDIIKTARARVANLFGEKLANKASEAFCLALGQSSPNTQGSGLVSLLQVS